MSACVRDKIFFSYSHQDEEWLNRILEMLKPSIRANPIPVWTDANISAGDKWEEEIKEALATAKVAVLLVSPAFLDSDFIAERELPYILKASSKGELKILWVALSACLYEYSAISKYKSLSNPDTPLDGLTPSRQNEEIVRICKKIQEAVEPAPPALTPIDVGLQPKSDAKKAYTPRRLILASIALAIAAIVIYFYWPPPLPEAQKKLAAIRDLQQGMPALNEEFKYWIKLEVNDSNRKTIDMKLTEIAERCGKIIANLKDCEREMHTLDNPYDAMAVHYYFAVAYYQLAAISRHRVDNTDRGIPTDSYDNQARGYARNCVEYTDESRKWSDQIEQRNLAEPANKWWSPDKLEAARAKLLDKNSKPAALHMQWYRTAGRSIMARYNIVPFKQVYAEVNELKTKFPHQDSPEDDPTMRWVLTFKNDERP